MLRATRRQPHAHVRPVFELYGAVLDFLKPTSNFIGPRVDSILVIAVVKAFAVAE